MSDFFSMDTLCEKVDELLASFCAHCQSRQDSIDRLCNKTSCPLMMYTYERVRLNRYFDKLLDETCLSETYVCLLLVHRHKLNHLKSEQDMCHFFGNLISLTRFIGQLKLFKADLMDF